MGLGNPEGVTERLALLLLGSRQLVPSETWEQGGQKTKTVAAAAMGTQAQRNTAGRACDQSLGATPLNSKVSGCLLALQKSEFFM